jgi:hypothetical protein
VPNNRKVRPSQPRRSGPSAQPRTNRRPQRAVRPPTSNRRVAPSKPRVQRSTPRGGVRKPKVKKREERKKRRNDSRNNNSRGRRPSRSRGR